MFDICHGCRRCFSLCNAFPTLFDAVDATATGEVDGVDEAGLLAGGRPLLPVRHVLHDEVSVRAAASLERRFPAPDAARQGGACAPRRTRLREQALAATDRVGALAGIPVVAEAVNAVNAHPRRPHAAREDSRRRPQRAAFRNITRAAPASDSRASAPPSGRRSPPPAMSRSRPPTPPGALRSSPPATATATSRELDEDLVKVFDHNGIVVTLLPSERCCGMPQASSSATSRRWHGSRNTTFRSWRGRWRAATTSSRRSPPACSCSSRSCR